MTRSNLRLTAAAAALVLLAGCAAGRAFRSGQNAARRGDWDAAVAYYREALGHDPGRIDVKIALQRAMTIASAEHVKRARDLEDQDQLAGAIAEYKLAADLDPTNALATAKANELERRQRERVEAARPPSSIDVLRQQVRQSGAFPTLDPRVQNVTVNFPAASVKDILNSIGALTGINVTYVTGIDQLTGHVYSINLQGASLEEALNQVLSNNQLAFKIVNSKTILVFQDSQPMHQLYDDLYSQVFYLSNIEPADMVQIINQLISPPGPAVRPQVAASKSTSAITVKATAPVLALIERIIRANDKPKAEVMIDVEILEVDRKRMKQLGLDLNQYALGFTFSPEVAPPNTAGTFPPATPPPFNLNTISQGVSAADFYMTVPTAVVRLLESDQHTRTLARPQARGQEGQAITVNLGDQIPIVNSFIPQTATAGGFISTPSANVTYKPVGVNLTITPQVTFDDDIILQLVVDNSGLGPNLDVAGQTFPTFTARTVQTKLRLRDGESNLLAGLIREQSSRTTTGLTGLARIPVLRNLFGNSNTTIDQSDVVIVVTPHIVRSHDLTAGDLRPMYLGTGQNFGQTGPPQLISPEVPIPGGVTPTAPGAAAPAVPAGAPPRAPGVVPVVPVTPIETPPVTAGAQVTVAAAGDFQAGSATPYTVPIMVSNVSDLGTVTLQIRYNPTVLRAQAVNNGTFMNQGNAAPTFVPRIDPNAGLVEIAISRPGAPSGASTTTSALLASIQFQAIAAGSSQIAVSGTGVTPAGQPIQMQFVPATVVVR